jgi:ribosomal protein S18 acetylase RimI-like enzyme
MEEPERERVLVSRAGAPARERVAGTPASAGELLARPMTGDDLPAAAAVSAASFGLDLSEESVARNWRGRVAHLLGTDPGGAFVAEQRGRVIGVSQAMRRERLWCLSLLSVEPGVQSAGAGRALLGRALGYAAATDVGLIVSSNDPRALRLYAASGFSLIPTFHAEGSIDRRALPRPDPGVRECDGDLDALAPISREVRGAAHTRELEYARGRGARVMRLGSRGFVVAQPGQGVWLLAARDEPAATTLLWSALALTGEAERPAIRWITGGQGWAVDVAVRARLRISASGALGVRGRPGTLRPFIPSAAFA